MPPSPEIGSFSREGSVVAGGDNGDGRQCVGGSGAECGWREQTPRGGREAVEEEEEEEEVADEQSPYVPY
jgi:hypothetical protein